MGRIVDEQIGRSIQDAAIAALVVVSLIPETLLRIALTTTGHVRWLSRRARRGDSLIWALALLLSIAVGIFAARV